jgi:hypothetical protein
MFRTDLYSPWYDEHLYMLQYDTTPSEPAQVLDLVEVVGTSVASRRSKYLAMDCRHNFRVAFALATDLSLRLQTVFPNVLPRYAICQKALQHFLPASDIHYT